MTRRSAILILLELPLVIVCTQWAWGQVPSGTGGPTLAPPPRPVPPIRSDDLKAVSLRGIGPAITPGRVGDIAIHPRNPSIWYVAVASGGVWKTTNRGIDWTPIFDQQGSYSIGCITIDPNNPDIVWVGTGENQSQRSVGFGDGVYKSNDGGQTWSHMGLRRSEHIARILIDPRDSNTVYVASQGPLWSAGGERGLFKSTDGGKTWNAVLTISENTGITDCVMDPFNPDVLYAASYQRRRHVGVLVGGGPEGAIYKSTDAGQTWQKLTKGLPEGDLGRIALAVSPHKPGVVYAHIQTAAKDRGGFYRSEDGGASWERRGSTPVQTGEYYGEIVADPQVFDRVYIFDTVMQVTEDGGKTFRRLRWPVHVDHHALAFDPHDRNHILNGNDGGLYESYDGGKTWRHFTNLPTLQFYRIAVDDAVPFYNIYGGTQDNGTVGGPSRTRHRIGIRNADWGVYGGGDGMQPRVEPGNPNIVYISTQYGALLRLNKATGRSTSVRPRFSGKGKDAEPEPDGDAGQVDPSPAPPEKQPKVPAEEPKTSKGDGLRWGWDAPLIISPHSPTRLYFAANRVFKSDDRGNTWKAISPDLTRHLDPLKVPIMGKLWGKDAVSRDAFTTPLSIVTALAESPLRPGRLYVGTDDGLVQISDDDGHTWRKVERFPGVPPYTYVSDIFASARDADTVYVTFNNWQYGDFRPYIVKSTDGGRSWTPIAGDLPDRHVVWSIMEDRVNGELLFAGTEFGLFVTWDGGQHWVRVPGAPPIPFRDLQVQEREGDLVCGTFGRGIYVLDDYAVLRDWTPDNRLRTAVLLPIRRTWRVAELPYARAAGEYVSPNPPAGTLITYHLGQPPPAKSRLVVRISDAAGRNVRDLPANATPGLHRLAWDLRPSFAGPSPKGPPSSAAGDLVPPGKYRATLMLMNNNQAVPLCEPQEFEVVAAP